MKNREIKARIFTVLEITGIGTIARIVVAAVIGIPERVFISLFIFCVCIFLFLGHHLSPRMSQNRKI